MSTPQVLVVAEPTDGGARAASRFASTGAGGTGSSCVGSACAVLSSADLSAARWRHRISDDGIASTLITTRSGIVIDSDRLRLVWFRGQSRRQRQVDAADAEYAQAESTALLVSWLAGLGDRVDNRVDGAGPLGPCWSTAMWLSVAAGAGLPVAPRTAATSARAVPRWCGRPWEARRPVDDYAGSDPNGPGLLLIDGAPVAPSRVDFRVAAGRALARASGCRLLRIGLDPLGRVTGVDPCPPLTATDDIITLAAMLRSATTQERAA